MSDMTVVRRRIYCCTFAAKGCRLLLRLWAFGIGSLALLITHSQQLSQNSVAIGNGNLFVSARYTSELLSCGADLYQYYSQCHHCTCRDGSNRTVQSEGYFKCRLFDAVGYDASCSHPSCGGGHTPPCRNSEFAWCHPHDVCKVVPPLGWLLWVEVYPESPNLNWTLMTQGWREITQQATGNQHIVLNGRKFKLYFHESPLIVSSDDIVTGVDIHHFGVWTPSLRCSGCPDEFTALLAFKAGRGWLSGTAVQRQFAIYLMPYHRAWQLYASEGNGCYNEALNRCNPQCCYWDFAEGWNWRPIPGAAEVWDLTIASLPAEADAAMDNRPVCEDLSLPPTNPRFGKYTYMGGLFVG